VRIFAIGITFAMALVISRSLRVADTGVFFLVYSLVNVGAAFGRFGTDNLVLILSAESRNKILRQVKSLFLAVFIASTAAFGGLGWILSAILGNSSVIGSGLGVGWVVALSVYPLGFAVLSGATLRANGRMATGTFAELGTIPAFVTVAQLVAWLAGFASLSSAVLFFAAGAWISAIWSSTIMFRALRNTELLPAESVGHFQFLRLYVARLSTMMGGVFLTYVVVWAPVLLLGAFSTGDQVALFAVAQRIAAMVTVVVAIQLSYMTPAMARFFSTRSIPDLNRYLRRGVTWSVSLVILPAVVILCFSEQVLRLLFGDAFSAAASTLVILVVSALLTVVGGHVNALMILCNLEKQLFVLTVCVALMWLSLGSWLIQEYGSMGAAFATLVGSVMSVIAGASLLWQLQGIKSFLNAGGFPGRRGRA
jgi:O-antigen/teichoic acid export membrane protein